MKKFGFIKKITAAATAAAMVTSLGISAFALEGNAGTGITIDTIGVTETDKPGIYTVTVGFTANSTNNIGMTMLTYGKKPAADGAEVNMVLDPSWTNNQYDGETMKVIGVDQIAGVSNGSGTFEFNVSTNKGTDSIYLAKGTTALIALSGDGVSVPAVAPLTITAIAAYGAPAEISSSDPVALDANLTADEIQDTIKAALQTKAVTTSVYEKSTDTTALKENVPLYGDNVTIGTFTKAADSDVYTGTVTINAVEGVSVQTGGIPVAVTVNTVKTAVDAAKATAVEDMSAVVGTDNKFATTVAATDNADANAVVENNFVGKKVTLTDSTGTVTGTVTITNAMVTPGAYTVGETSAYTIAIPAGTTSNSLLTVPAGGITVTVDVTVSAAPVVKGMFGDVNNDKVIDYTDVGEIIAYITASSNGQEYPFIDANDPEKTVDLKFADVTADFKLGDVVVDYSDVGEVIAKITAESNGSEYVFEADK